MKIKRAIVIGVALLGVTVLVAAILPHGEQTRLHASARIKWKKQAIMDVMKRSADRQLITSELAALRDESTHTTEGWWVGTNALLMTNGEYLVFSDINAKQDGRIHDLFIARGSDGKWYYSTYHFCVQMISVRIDEASGSIGEFAKTYFAKEFDGLSDEYLQKTWPVRK